MLLTRFNLAVKDVLYIKYNNFHSNNCKESKVTGKKHRYFIFYRAESTELADAS